MKIVVYLSEICGSYYELRENLSRALADLGTGAEISYHTITYDDAVSLNIKGSPSLWINGTDAFESGRSPGIA